ncbi:hypothetical protein [Streptomyces sp. NPDC020917]|uniref:hypothetical protein n=1 Tax=Streptomyces sp. NPDC020917 TaxID=3365102 RepID=UPI0037A42F9E
MKAAAAAFTLATSVLAAVAVSAPAAHAAAALTVTNPVLVFDQGASTITVSSDQTSVSYTVGDESGTQVASGTTAVVSGAGSINLTSLGPGYYTLSVTAGSGTAATTVPTTFAVLSAFAPGTSTTDQRFGMDIHFGHQPNDATLFPLISHLGFSEVRTDQNWALVENPAGTYNWSNYVTDAEVPLASQSGLRTLLISGYSNPNYDGGYTPYTQAGWNAFGAYTNGIASHFGQYTKDIEVYNEFDGGFDTAAACAQTVTTKVNCYLNMLKSVYQAVKISGGHTDTNLIGPVSAGIDKPWISGLLSAGALQYINTFSIHAYADGNPENAFGEIPWLKQQIRDNNSGKDMPLWLTESGQTVMPGGATEADQADYAVRLPVLAFAAGIDKYFWYDLLNDGTGSTNKEYNFGLLKQPTTGVVAQAPKPALATQATILRQIGGLPFTGSDGLTAPAYSYRFGSGSNTTHVMWATTPSTVQVTASGPVTVTDEFGRQSTYTPVSGAVTLSLDQHPLFVRNAAGAAATLKMHVLAQPPVTLSVPQTSNTAESIPATITAHSRIPLTGAVYGKRFTLVPDASGAARATIDVPTNSQLGKRTVVVKAGVAGVTSMRLAAETTVVAATTVTTVPHVSSANPLHNQLKITITNHRTQTPLPISSVDWKVLTGTTVQGSGTFTGIADIPPGQSTTITADVPTLPTWDKQWFFDRVTEGSGAQSTDAGWTGWNPVEPAGAGHAPPINLGTQVDRTYTNGGYGGANDLSGTLRPSFTATGLEFVADVTDNVFDQPNTDPSLMWNADSIQFAITPALPGLNPQRVEIGAALLPSGPAVYTWTPPTGQSAGPTPGATASITRSGSVTHYQVDVPWSALGTAGPPTVPFGLSALVNDNDGKGRNFAAWGDGIAATKNSSLLRPVQLVND